VATLPCLAISSDTALSMLVTPAMRPRLDFRVRLASQHIWAAARAQHPVGRIPSPSYRGFLPKPGGIRVITFRVTTRLQSKSNRCI
jgi:hypothetical protein